MAVSVVALDVVDVSLVVLLVVVVVDVVSLVVALVEEVTLSNRTTISQCGVCGKRSTDTD